MFGRLQIAWKIFVGFAVLGGAAVVIAGLGVASLSAVQGSLEQIVDRDAEKARLAADVDKALVAMSRAERSLILSTNVAEMESHAQSFRAALDTAEAAAAGLSDLADESEQAKLAAFDESLGAYREVEKPGPPKPTPLDPDSYRYVSGRSLEYRENRTSAANDDPSH